jgi:hypothetical protein
MLNGSKGRFPEVARLKMKVSFRLTDVDRIKRETRVKWLLDMLTWHFYTSPFQHRHLPSEAGVAF